MEAGLTLQPRSLGLFADDKFDRPVFDDKVAKDSEMQLGGLNGGVVWEETVSTYFTWKGPPMPGGTPAGSSDNQLAFLVENGGNGICHCRHVTDLM